ncbi:MAG TPA: glycine oxidase ThiO [Candidatus Micrarchaeaceae archaeon]|nr:glycine oxidase ThiO [Candidatus Micrarchaeaceae archaeon]
MSSATRVQCLVVGGGVVGLAVAVSLAQRGASVRVLERGPRCGEGASAAAAGMLAAGAEATEAGPFQQLCHRSRELWPNWAAALTRTSGVDCELDRTGLVRVSSTEEGVTRLQEQAQWQRDHGVDASSTLGPAQLSRLVPGLGPNVLAGIHFPNDGHVHSHRVVDALVASCAVLGVTIETEAEVSAIKPRSGGVRLSLADDREEEADYLVVCAGSWSGRLLQGLGRPEPKVEPIRGQIVALDPRRTLLPVIVFGDDGYLLQKRSGLVLAGTTEERVGFRSWPTLAGVRSVMAGAVGLLPELAEARFAHAWAGLRPHAPDGWPLLGRVEPGGRVLVATAHYRNGVLLAPITAELLARAVFEGVDPPELEAFSPRRLL